MMKAFFIYIMLLLAFLGFVPLFVLCLQFVLVGFHRFRSHYTKCQSYIPRVAILVPAWNEAEVINTTMDSLLQMNYPRDALRIYIVDDGSNDATPDLIHAKHQQFPENVFHVRRENGGQGKAHTLNYGLNIILADDWTQAILIMDADVLFAKDALLKMTRHLADPQVGAVTAYIKEGSRPGNIVNHFIAFEYIAAQAAARRAQNVLGVLACLAGGAQLHTRKNIEAIGGQIDTTTLAEDTYTTFETQLVDHKVVFDGNALVYAEEPDNLAALWKQRFRWARGNIHLTVAFLHVWFRKGFGGLGNILFGLIWFSILLMPFFMIACSIGLVTLFFIDPAISWQILHKLALVGLVAYLFITLYAFLIDIETTKRSWLAGILFPGLISILTLFVAAAPHYFECFFADLFGTECVGSWRSAFLLFINAWVALNMLCAWGVYQLDRTPLSKKITNTLLVLVGYGPVLCAVSLAAFSAEVKNKTIKWDKTEKQGKTLKKPDYSPAIFDFNKTLANDMQHERRIFWYQCLVIVAVATILTVWQLLSS